MESYSEIHELIKFGSRQLVFFRYTDLCERITEPYMITHQKAVLPEVAARDTEIDRIIDTYHLWKWHKGAYYRNWSNKRDLEKARREFDRRQIDDALIEFNSNKFNTKGAAKSAPFSVLYKGHCISHYLTSKWKLILRLKLYDSINTYTYA